MLLDLRHQIVERLRRVGSAGALSQRKIAKTRRTERKVKRNRDDGQSNEGNDCGRPA